MKKPISRRFSFEEVSEIAGVDRVTVVEFIQREWICPASENELDQEDLARIRLIQDLRGSFGVNDEAVPLILHLMDQLYHLRHRINHLSGGE